jgi:hypothetical protein
MAALIGPQDGDINSTPMVSFAHQRAHGGVLDATIAQPRIQV